MRSSYCVDCNASIDEFKDTMMASLRTANPFAAICLN